MEQTGGAKNVPCALHENTAKSYFKKITSQILTYIIHYENVTNNSNLTHRDWVPYMIGNTDIHFSMLHDLQSESQVTTKRLCGQKGHCSRLISPYRESLPSLRMHIIGPFCICNPNMTFLWHSSVDIDKISLFPNFQSILSFRLRVMHVWLYRNVA